MQILKVIEDDGITIHILYTEEVRSPVLLTRTRWSVAKQGRIEKRRCGRGRSAGDYAGPVGARSPWLAEWGG